jgi:uncharacterized protein (TIGR00369 family)
MDAKDSFQQLDKSLFGGLVGLRFTEAAPERVVAQVTVRDELCTTGRVMHGGAIMALADSLGGYATALNLPPGAGTTTIESKTNFLGPAAAGTTVTAECEPVHRGKRTMVWRTKITGEDGRPVAIVTQTQIVLEPKPSPQQLIGSLFQGMSMAEQKELLATLERGGATIYRMMAAAEPDAARKAALLAAAEREEENALLLERGG